MRPAALVLVALLGTALPAAAWGPEGGFPGTLDIVHNRAQPARLRSWAMNASVVCWFAGNDTAANSPAEASAEARFGTVGIGWQLRAISSNFSHLERWEVAQARQLKAARPGIRTLVTRNSDCGGLNWDAVAAALADHPDYFLRQPPSCPRRGQPGQCKPGAIFEVPWVANDPKFFGHENFWMLSPYFNFSAPNASRWWVDTFIGDAVRNPLYDGVYCEPKSTPPTPPPPSPPPTATTHYPNARVGSFR